VGRACRESNLERRLVAEPLTYTVARRDGVASFIAAGAGRRRSARAECFTGDSRPPAHRVAPGIASADADPSRVSRATRRRVTTTCNEGVRVDREHA